MRKIYQSSYKKYKLLFPLLFLSLILYVYQNDQTFLNYFLLNETVPVFNNQKEEGLFKYVFNKDENSIFMNQSAMESNEKKEYDELDIYGFEKIEFQTDSNGKGYQKNSTKINLVKSDILPMPFEEFKRKFYVIDKRTDLREKDISIEKFLNMDLSIDYSNTEPLVLIFHTHGSETYIDSKGIEEGVMGVGEKLKNILEQKYKIKTIHHKERFDMLEGQTRITGAYERAAPVIEEIVRNNPSIQVVIDIHRDAIPNDVKLNTNISGKPTAQIMFVNGLSQIYKENEIKTIDYLKNPNREKNLAFSFQLQLLANSNFPGFTRKIYLNAYRYNLYIAPRSLLMEVGSQNNTKQEAFNAMEPFADVLAKVIGVSTE